MASNNSSKTAHVMNLLSKNRGSAPEPPAEPKAEPAAPQRKPPSPLYLPVTGLSQLQVVVIHRNIPQIQS